MPPGSDPVTDLSRLSADELAKLGEESLRDHIAAQAVVAHHKHAPLTFARLEALLSDAECLRYPVRLVFEFGEMAAHQFADPGVDLRNPEQNGRVLCLRPLLRDRPDLAVLAVAYMIPVLNYGDIVTDDQCIRYGATLLGMMEEEFYEAVGRVADFVGAEVREARTGTPFESELP
jgi:hypothetical protein